MVRDVKKDIKMKWQNLFLLKLFAGICLCLNLFAAADLLDEEDEIEELNTSASNQEPKTLDLDRIKKQRLGQNLKKLHQLVQKPDTIKETALVSLCSQILNDESDNVQALNALAAFYLKNHKTQMAKIILTRGMKVHPKNSALVNNMGVVALKRGETKEAIAYFRDSLKYRYSNYSAAANLGTLYLDSHDEDSSLDFLKLAYYRASSYLPKGHIDTLRIGNNYAVALAWIEDSSKAWTIFNDITNFRQVPPKILLNYSSFLGKNLSNYKQAFVILNKVDLMDSNRRYASRVKQMRVYFQKAIAAKTKGGR